MVNHSCLLLRNHVDRQYKGTDDTVPDDGPFRWDGTQHDTEEELRTFPRANGAYDRSRLNPLGCSNGASGVGTKTARTVVVDDLSGAA